MKVAEIKVLIVLVKEVLQKVNFLLSDACNTIVPSALSMGNGQTKNPVFPSSALDQT
jgi:hypothetical protein